jgi:proteasome lid subunit RPN8/RPN11
LNFPSVGETVCRALVAAVHDRPGQEVCGFLVERLSILTFRRVPNLGGAGEFWIEQGSLDQILSDITRSHSVVRAFIHSHGSSVHLSASDEALIRFSQWPWLVVVCIGTEIQGEWFWTEVGEIRSEKMTIAKQNSFLGI